MESNVAGMAGSVCQRRALHIHIRNQGLKCVCVGGEDDGRGDRVIVGRRNNKLIFDNCRF